MIAARRTLERAAHASRATTRGGKGGRRLCYDALLCSYEADNAVRKIGNAWVLNAGQATGLRAEMATSVAWPRGRRPCPHAAMQRSMLEAAMLMLRVAATLIAVTPCGRVGRRGRRQSCDVVLLGRNIVSVASAAMGAGARCRELSGVAMEHRRATEHRRYCDAMEHRRAANHHRCCDGTSLGRQNIVGVVMEHHEHHRCCDGAPLGIETLPVLKWGIARAAGASPVL